MTDRKPDRMILLMGLPRSGTTWLGKIFDSHPDTFYSHEPDSARPFRGLPLLIPTDSAEQYRTIIESHVAEMRPLRTMRIAGKLPLFPKSYSPRLPDWARNRGLLILKGLSRVLGDIPVPTPVSGAPQRASYWVWKSIESTGRLGALARVFPDARAIFIIRHPCGVAASLLRGERSTKFSDGPASEDHGFFQLLAETDQARSRGLSVDRFRSMSPVERVAWRWALLNEKALDDLDGLPNCRVLRYEDLCERPREASRDLFAFSRLSWNEQTERFVSMSVAGEDSSYYAVFKNPLRSAYKWKEQLPPAVIEGILEIAAQTRPGQLYAGQDSFESAPHSA